MVDRVYRRSFHIRNGRVESHRRPFGHAPWAQIAFLLQAVRQRALARLEAVHGGRCCHCCFQHAQACAAAASCCVQSGVEACMCQA
jgi:hypothetical protein